MKKYVFAFTITIFAFFLSNHMLLAQKQSFDFEKHSKKVKIKGEDFSLVDYGSGPVVLLLHGFPDSKLLWKNQIPALADAGFRVIAPDLRGYAGAPQPLEKEKYVMPILMGDEIG